MITRYKADAPRAGETLAVAAIMVTDADGDWVDYEDHVLALMAHDKLLAERGAALAACDKRIAKLQADRRVLQSTGEHPAPCARHCEANAFRIELRNKDARIAELEKQAAIDKTLLALADARINRELRDDFAGLALAGTVAKFKYPQNIAEEAYAIADAMLKAKGGAR